MYAIMRESCGKATPGVTSVFHSCIIPESRIQNFIDSMADEGETWECVAKGFKTPEEASDYKNKHYTD
jgi:hypothetical protein